MFARHALGLAVAVCLLVPDDVLADTICVPDDQPTIQQAIDAAVDGDEICVSPGTYDESIDFLGKAVRLYSTGGPAVTTIDGRGEALHVVRCASGEGPETVLEGFSITGGVANGDPPDDSGGGMFVRYASPSIIDCAFVANAALEDGGGLYLDNAGATVVQCSFRENSAHHGGGIASNFSHDVVINGVFTGNVAEGFGGGMFNARSDTAVTNCAFIDNTARNGGGMANFAILSPIVARVVNSTFDGNAASLSGGALWNAYTANPVVTSCVLWRNTPQEIDNLGEATPLVTFCDVRGGHAGEGNISADPHCDEVGRPQAG